MRRVLSRHFGKVWSAGLGVLIAAGGPAAVIMGCSVGTNNSTFTSGTGGAGTTGAGGDDFNPSGTGTNGMSTGTGGACAATSSEANFIPVNMFIVFDKSGSMAGDKWTAASTALIHFFKDKKSANLRVALRFFPAGGCDEKTCDLNACSQPLVALAPLMTDSAPGDTQEANLVEAVESIIPEGGTPMFAALGGAELWAATYQTAHPTEKTLVVLVTDGDPGACDENVSHIAQLALTTNNVNGVLTYALGLPGSSMETMNTIAKAGGTDHGFFIGINNGAADLVATLQAIQGSQVSCTIQIPTMSTTGEPIDPTRVNVTYTHSGGGASVTFGQVATSADCAAQTGVWFYDNPAYPTTITLCPSTCTSVKADQNAKIEVLLGCATKPAE